jgi:zinc transporter ZupT
MQATTTDSPGAPRAIPWRLIGLAVLPLVLLVAFLGLLLATGSGLRPSGAPPVEALTVQRVVLPAPGQMEVHVANGGPSPVTIAQVAVDDAYWQFAVEPSATIPRLGSAVFRLDYPWVEAEPHEVMLVTSTGVTFAGAVDVALAAPDRGPGMLLQFLLLGFYVGVVPVALGLLWYPVVKQLGARGLAFILSLTVGLLVFLLVDTLLEALELAAALPAGYHGAPLVWLVALLTVGLIEALGAVNRRGRSALGVATLIALGIGLHNFGEGLAIGAAYTLGELALGAFLVIGFTLHNVTEGLAVAAPLSRAAPRLRHFVLLVLLAGAPAMLGTWVGAFAYSDLAAALFLAIGAGAIAQVVYSVSRYTAGLLSHEGQPALSPVTLGGFAAGVGLMYATALMVAA